MATDPTTLPTIGNIQQAKKDMTDINTFVVSEQNAFTDNTGKSRKTMEGIESEADNVINNIRSDADIVITNIRSDADSTLAEKSDEFDLTLDQYKESRGFNTKGTFADGFTYELPNDVGLDADGNPWILIDTSSLPVTVTAGTTPTNPPYKQVSYGTASQVSTNTSDTVQSFIDSFSLKIFQSPTDGGLTEIQTRTVNSSEVYEVRKTSDDSLATIYSDAAGTTEIMQNGTDNKSGSDGVVEFYVVDGDYYIEVGGVQGNFNVAGKNQVELTVDELSLGLISVGTTAIITDRGYAKFKIESGGAANGFDVLDAGAGNTAVLQSLGRVSAIAMGCKLSDISKDTINAQVLNYALNNGYFVKLPAGIIYSKPLEFKGVKNSGFKGVSNGISEIIFTGESPSGGFVALGDSGRTNACRRMLFSDFRVSATNGLLADRAFNLLYCVDSSFKRLEVHSGDGFIRLGFNIDWSWDNKFDRNFLETESGFYVDDQANNNKISGNRMGSSYSSNGVGIELNRGAANEVSGSNDISSCNIGILINGASAVLIESNWFESNTGGDIVFSGSLPTKTITITGNQFESRGLTTPQESVKQVSGGFASEGVTLKGNLWNANNDGLTKCIVMAPESLAWDIGKNEYLTSSRIFYNGATTEINNGGARWISGEGSPESSVLGALNDIYTDVLYNVMYKKQSGSSSTNTGWEILEASVNGQQEGTQINASDSGTVTLNSSYDTIRYTKKGALVTGTGSLKVQTSDGVGYFTVQLPYTAHNSIDSAAESAVNVLISNSVSSTVNGFVGKILEGDSFIRVYGAAGNKITSDSAEQLKGLTDITLSFSYFA